MVDDGIWGKKVMVLTGYAWWYEKYAPDEEVYGRLRRLPGKPGGVRLMLWHLGIGGGDEYTVGRPKIHPPYQVSCGPLLAVSEDNLDYLRKKHALYIVGTPKSQLRRVEQQLLDSGNWEQVIYSKGGGIRYLIASKLGLQMGIDVAEGPAGTAICF